MSTAGLQSDQSVPSHQRGVWLGALLLCVLGIAAYSNSFQVPFLFDDHESIPQNPTIRKLWPPGPIFLPWTQGVTVAGRPIVNLSLAINYSLGELDVRGYHLFNLLIHLLAGLTLFGLIRRTLLLPQFTDGPRKRATSLALVCALIWTLHPLQTESVTYLIQRAESLVGLFYLLTLYSVVRAATAVGSASRKGWSIAAVLSCLLGVGCKEVMATAPMVVLLYDRFFLSDSFSTAWKRRRGLYLGLAACWIVQGVLVVSAGSRGGSAGFTAGISPWQYAGTQFGAILHYLRLSFWPHPLVFDYGKTLAQSLPTILFPALGLVLVAGALLLAARRWPPVGFVALAAALILAPSSSIVPIATQSVNEHRFYLPLAGVILLFVLLMDRLLTRFSALRIVTAGIVVVLCVAATWRRNVDYRSSLSIWEDTVAKYPSNARAHNNYGHELLKVERKDEAFEQFSQAIALNQRECDPLYNRSLLLEARGKQAAALGDMELASRYCPFSKEFAIRLGKLLAQSGRYNQAVSEFTRALKFEPNGTLILFERGSCYQALGRHDDAIRDYTAILEREPDVDLAWHNRGNAYASIGRLEESIRDLTRAIELRPDAPDAYRNRAVSYFENRQYDRAWEDVDRCRAKGGNVGDDLLKSLQKVAPRNKPANP